MAETLFERVGGKLGVRAVVIRLYRHILADMELAPFFANIGIERLRASQESFVSYALGAPEQYLGRSMREAHAGAVARGLNDNHFDLVVSYLEKSMRELNLADDIIAEALRVVGGTRSDVLNR